MNKTRVFKTNFIRQIIDQDLSSGQCTSICTRFPPEPNGYLHIGHAKSICLNFGLAQDYHGKCNLRFDDTNPIKEDVKYVESIKRDIKWLGFQWSGEIRYSSDYFDNIYGYAVELIKKGLAYVDELSPEEIHEYRGTLTNPGKNSPYRNRLVEENLFLFNQMRIGNFEEGKACLRAKIDMTSPIMVMRDPVLYRIKFVEHQKTNKKWCIYPMYDFAHCISDAQEGITHSLCTLEFQTNRRLYDWILRNINIPIRYPRQYEFSRLNLEYTIMSKRKLNLLVMNHYVEGWDDPRMPTISGLRRRGYTANSIREFCERIGVTRQDNTIKVSSLESCIRNDLNENAPRVMVVTEPVKLIISNYPKGTHEMITMFNHPKKPEMGNRQVPFSNEVWINYSDFKEKADKNYKRLTLGKEVRLRNAYIIKAEYTEKDKRGNVIKIYCTYDSNTLGKNPVDGRRVKGVIHWVSVSHALPVIIRLYSHLFKVPNPSTSKNFLETFNPKSLVIKEGYAEPSLKEAEVEKAYQFEREGYFCLDSHYLNSNKMVFNLTVSLRKNLESR